MGKCGCGSNHCNNSCKPICDPCGKQPKMLYCGRPIDCLNINRGDKLDDIIKIVGDKICQIQGDIDQISYVNIEDATVDQCEYGGYVIQVLDLGSDNLIEEAIICNAIPLTFQENGVEISQALTVNFEDSDTISVTATHDVPSDTTTYSFDTINTTNITWQEGIDLMDNSLVIPNMLYFITDRGWYLQGIDSDNFTIEGYKIDRVVKEEYYTPTPMAGIKGVWNLSVAPFVAGNIVVYGGKVWVNNAGVTGTSIDLFTLSNNWTVSNLDIYYENKLLKISVDYRDNWVFKQEDDKNNIISIPKVIYGSFGLNRVWSDWNMPNFYNNSTSLVLNNAPNKSLTIHNNIGSGKITDNYADTIRDNYIKYSDGIFKNKTAKIEENTIEFYSNNTVANCFNNIFDAPCYNNVITSNFKGNICRGVINDNTLPFIENSIMEDVFSSNQRNEAYANAGVKNSRFISEVTGNVFYFLGVEDSLVLDSMLNNDNIQIFKSRVGTTVNNEQVRVLSSYFEGGVNDNLVTTVNSSEGSLFNSNENCSVSSTKALEIVGNTECSIVSNQVTGLISNNSHSTLSTIQFNFCKNINDNIEVDQVEGNCLYGSISNNTRLDSISYNKVNGDITNNISTSNPSTGIQINQNTSNGSIFYNTIDDSVVITNNNNNGNIGVNAVPTARVVSISGTIVNL